MKKDKKKQETNSGSVDGNKNNGSVSERGKELNPLPAFINTRIQLWDKLKQQYDEELHLKPKVPITITLPDGKTVQGNSWTSTPYDIACGISKGLADNTIIAKVNNELWDLDRPLEQDCTLSLLKFDDPEAQAVFWHSSAHVLGEAMERVRKHILFF